MPEFLEIEHAGLTDVGVKRSHNQDAFAVHLASDPAGWQRSGHVFIVADGMGGHAVGEKASAKASQDIPHTYVKNAHEGPAPTLRRAFLEVNAGIHAVGQKNPEFKGLGTTATALVLKPEGAWVGHVGDSRVYRIRDGQIDQLSFDHSLVWALAAKEGIAPEDLPDIRRNVIIRSLGPDPLVEVDIEGPHPLQTGDVFVLCSDGLSGQLTDQEIGVVASSLPPDEAVALLVDLANLRGGPDNTTVVVVRVGEVPQPVQSPRSQRRSLGRGLSRAARSVARAWSRRVPWPLTVLLFGLLLTVGFVVSITAELPGSRILFGLAALAVGVGLVGLGLHALRGPGPNGQDDEWPARMNVYRSYPCALDREELEKFVHIGEQLRQHSEERGWKADLTGYEQACAAAREKLLADDLAGAFREQCRAVKLLAEGFNRNRQKEEAFAPKWDLATAD